MTKTCIIEVQDYKNIKLHNLDPDVRRKCVNALKFKDPKARYLPSVKMGRWDGTVSFCSIGGQTYVNFLPVVVPIIEAADYTFEICDRRPEENYSFDPIDQDFFKQYSWWEGHPFAGQPIVLNDHQVEAVNALLATDSGLIQAATSSGKTLICCALSRQVEKYGRSLIIVPNRDLVDQTYDDYKNLGLDVGKIYFGQRDLTNQHVICTWQSLHRIDKRTKEEPLSEEEMATLLDGMVMTIGDECHLFTSKVLFHINSNLLKHIPLTYGMTGTIPKEDHLRATLRANFGEVVYTISAKELQDKGILSNCQVEINHLQLENTKYKDYPSEKKAVNTDIDVLSVVASDVNAMANSEKGNTLVLVENLDTGFILEELIENSIFLSGKDSSKSRKKEYKEVNVSDDKVIIATYGIASTGISITRLFNLVLFNPGKSFVRTIQSIGRGLRKGGDKDFVNIKDYAMNTKYSSRHLGERKSFYKEQEYPFTVVKRKVF